MIVAGNTIQLINTREYKITLVEAGLESDRDFLEAIIEPPIDKIDYTGFL